MRNEPKLSEKVSDKQVTAIATEDRACHAIALAMAGLPRHSFSDGGRSRRQGMRNAGRAFLPIAQDFRRPLSGAWICLVPQTHSFARSPLRGRAALWALIRHALRAFGFEWQRGRDGSEEHGHLITIKSSHQLVIAILIIILIGRPITRLGA